MWRVSDSVKSPQPTRYRYIVYVTDVW